MTASFPPENPGRPVVPSQSAGASKARAGRGRIELMDLLGGGNEVEIAHQGQLYVLRLTRNNKLILTK